MGIFHSHHTDVDTAASDIGDAASTTSSGLHTDSPNDALIVPDAVDRTLALITSSRQTSLPTSVAALYAAPQTPPGRSVVTIVALSDGCCVGPERLFCESSEGLFCTLDGVVCILNS